MLLPEIEALIEMRSLVLEEKPITLTPVPPRAALPNRIAVCRWRRKSGPLWRLDVDRGRGYAL